MKRAQGRFGTTVLGGECYAYECPHCGEAHTDIWDEGKGIRAKWAAIVREVQCAKCDEFFEVVGTIAN